MIVPDINLLLYATFESFPEHRAARLWWEDSLNQRAPVGIAAPVLFGYLRLATNGRVFDPPMAAQDAVSTAEQWLSRPHVRFLVPGPHHLEIAFRLIKDLGTAANLTTDVQIAATALEHQAEVHSCDTDFGRFSGLRWTNPLRTYAGKR